MARVHEAQSLTGSVEEVWAVIGGFNALPEWHPAVESSTLEEGGRIRRLLLEGGASLVERLHTFNETERSYGYSIEQGPLPVAHYRSQVKVTGQPGERRCSVEWSGEFSAAGVPEPEAISIIRGIYRAGLDRLGERFGA